MKSRKMQKGGVSSVIQAWYKAKGEKIPNGKINNNNSGYIPDSTKGAWKERKAINYNPNILEQMKQSGKELLDAKTKKNKTGGIVPKAQMGKIVKTVSNAAKVAGKGAKKVNISLPDVLSVHQKERLALGKPVYRGSNPTGNMTMKEIQTKKDLQKAVQKIPKKLSKEQQYLKDIEDSYKKKGGSIKSKKK